MMRTLRDNTKVILWILILVFVATIVFSWGMGGFDTVSGPTGTVVANVDGEEIDFREYERLVSNRLQQTGDRADNAQVLNARKNGWNDLVNLALERQACAELGINASDGEVADMIQYMPPASVTSDTTFMSNGVFDTLKWHDILRSENLKGYLLAMEAQYRQSLPYQKLRSRINSFALASDADLEEDFLVKNQTAQGRYMVFPYNTFDVDSASVTEADLKAWYDSKRDDFKSDEEREIDYVQFEVKPSAEDTLDAQDQIAYIKRQLDRGESFEDMARTYSTDASNADRGGDLGWFGPGRMVPAFEEAAFAAEIGSIVGPVETRFGLHLIKVNDHEERDKGDGEKEEQVSAQHILIKYEASSMTHSDLRAKADALYEDAQNGNFEVLCAERGFEIKEGRPFAKGGNVPGVGRSARASDLVYAAQEGSVISPVYDARGGWFVMRLKKVMPEGLKPLSEVRDRVYGEVYKQKQQDKALAAAEAWLAANPVASLDSSLAASKIEFGQLAEPIKINQFIRGSIGRDLAFSTSLFTQPVGEIGKPFAGVRGAYIVECTARDDAGELLASLEKDLPTRRSDAINTQSSGAYGSWSRFAKDKALIEDNRVRFGIDY